MDGDQHCHRGRLRERWRGRERVTKRVLPRNSGSRIVAHRANFARRQKQEGGDEARHADKSPDESKGSSATTVGANRAPTDTRKERGDQHDVDRERRTRVSNRRAKRSCQ